MLPHIFSILTHPLPILYHKTIAIVSNSRISLKLVIVKAIRYGGQPATVSITNIGDPSNHIPFKSSCPSQSIRPTNSILNSFKCFHLFKCQLPSTVSKYAPLYVHLSLLCTLKDKFLKHSHLSFNNKIKDFRTKLLHTKSLFHQTSQPMPRRLIHQ